MLNWVSLFISVTCLPDLFFFKEKIGKGESEGWVEVAVKQFSLNYS